MTASTNIQRVIADLVCPVCKTDVDLVHEGQALKCRKCGRVYPIRDDIPVMQSSEAKVED